MAGWPQARQKPHQKKNRLTTKGFKEWGGHGNLGWAGGRRKEGRRKGLLLQHMRKAGKHGEGEILLGGQELERKPTALPHVPHPLPTSPPEERKDHGGCLASFPKNILLFTLPLPSNRHAWHAFSQTTEPPSGTLGRQEEEEQTDNRQKNDLLPLPPLNTCMHHLPSASGRALLCFAPQAGSVFFILDLPIGGGGGRGGMTRASSLS